METAGGIQYLYGDQINHFCLHFKYWVVSVKNIISLIHETPDFLSPHPA